LSADLHRKSNLLWRGGFHLRGFHLLERDVMTYVHRRPLALAAILCPALAFAFGCGRVPGQFEILNDQIPTPGTCTVPVDPTAYQGQGLLDVSIVRSEFQTAYFFFPLIENNLPRPTGDLDSNQIQITGFDVDIATVGAVSDSAAAVFASSTASPYLHYQTTWSGGVSSGGGQISAMVKAFPVPLAQQLLAAGNLDASPSLTVNLKIQALGSTNTGRSMQSDPFNFPVSICAGCLAANLGPCPLAATPANAGNACNAAQDQAVDCCTLNGALICPAVAAQ
jgi:hypothetical protein